MTGPAAFRALLPDATERGRYDTALETLRPYRHLFMGKRVLDYGCSWGTSAVAMLELGAASVIGVEPDRERVDQGNAWLQAAGLVEIDLRWVADTTRLVPIGGWSVLSGGQSGFTMGFPRYDFVLANAVFEHIPQSVRQAHIIELWRVVVPGGVLLINETPNNYWPREDHTTDGLWFNHWLPEGLAYNRAVCRGRYHGSREEWKGSGWRGLGWYELVRNLKGWRLVPETSRLRHRVLTAIGLPASLLDPYPTWVLRKVSS